jgi:hypothetical protein
MTGIAARLQWRVYPMLGRFRPDLGVDPEPYSRFQDPELRRIGSTVAKTRYYNRFPGVDGFMTVRERQALYAFARHLSGPFLEIGSWVGLSTCHIASGIRDSHESKRFEVVTGGETGVLVAPGSPTELAGAIVSLLGDEDRRRRLGEAARRRVETSFTFERMARHTADLYARTIEGRGATSSGPP